MQAYRDRLLAVIAAPDEAAKAALLRDIEPPPAAAGWSAAELPMRPGRAATIVEGRAPRRRKGIDDPQGRRRFLHAIWHIEISAIDLCCAVCLRAADLPPAFHRDQLDIAREEAEHAALLRRWLEEHDYPPGSEPVHHRLWDSARLATDVGEQLVVVPRFLEARGLDVTAELLPRMAAVDRAAHAVVDRIYHDEIGHVAIGTRWHRYWCRQQGLDPVDHFQSVCDRYFNQQIPGPMALDRDGRSSAGFWPEELDYLESGERE